MYSNCSCKKVLAQQNVLRTDFTLKSHQVHTKVNIVRISYAVRSKLASCISIVMLENIVQGTFCCVSFEISKGGVRKIRGRP